MIEQCLILCGGLGTRLGELTRSTPKPLLPVGDQPFIEQLLRELGRQGYRKILLLAAFEAGQIHSLVASSAAIKKFDMDVQVSVEPAQAGTGGAIWHAKNSLDDKFLLLNGDSWFDTSLRATELVLGSARGLTGALTLRHLPDVSRYGVVAIEAGKVSMFNPRPDRSGPGLVNAGVYAFDRSLIDYLQPVCSLEHDVLPHLATEGKLAGRVADGYFIDIGVPESYAAAQTEIPAKNRRSAMFLDRDGVMNIDRGHVGSRDRFDWIAGAKEAVLLANRAGCYVFIVTNQAGIAKKKYSLEEYIDLNRMIQADLAEIGAHIDDHRYCPHHLDAEDERYRKDCDWRKPKPGMILDLLKHWKIDRARSFLIGDNQTDLEAAQRAGILGLLFDGGNLLEFVEKYTPLGGKARE